MFKNRKLNDKLRNARNKLFNRTGGSMSYLKRIGQKQAEEKKVAFIKNNMGLARKVLSESSTKMRHTKEGRLFVNLARNILQYSTKTTSFDIFKQLKKTCVRNNLLKVLITTGFLMLSQEAYATTTGPGLPWEAPLQTFASSLQGPVATSVSILALIGAAASMMFFEVGRGMRWFLTAVIGFSVASTAFGVMALFGLTSALM